MVKLLNLGWLNFRTFIVKLNLLLDVIADVCIRLCVWLYIL